MKKTGKSLAKFYKMDVRNAYYHEDGNWYWPLKEFPGAYFDGGGCVVFATEKDFIESVYIGVGPTNIWIRHTDGISAMPEYRTLQPPPRSL